MLYLVTDHENKTLRDLQWSENVTYEETKNPNYLFSVYNDPIVGHMMNPAYEGFKNPNFWLVEGDIAHSFGFRHECSKLTALKKIDVQPPTDLQRIAFAILCSIHIVSNPDFKKWAKDYLSGNDRSKEKAESVMQKLKEIEFGIFDNPQDEYIGPAIATIMSVTVEANIFVANAAHRAYYDSPENDRIDMQKLANIVMNLSPEQLANVIC